MWIYIILSLLTVAVGLLVWKNYRLIVSLKEERLMLENLDTFVFLIDRDFNVVDSNYYMLTSTEEPERACVLGNVLHCKNGTDAGVCGSHENCKDCPVRHALEKAFEEKGEVDNLEARMQVYLMNHDVACLDVNLAAHYVKVLGKPHMVVCVKDITSDKSILRFYKNKYDEYRKGMSQKNIGTGDGNGSEDWTARETLPRLLFDTLNMRSFSRLQKALEGSFELELGENVEFLLSRVDKNYDYNYRAIILDDTFVHTDTIVQKVMLSNPDIPMVVFSSAKTHTSHDGILYVNDHASDAEILGLLQERFGQTEEQRG